MMSAQQMHWVHVIPQVPGVPSWLDNSPAPFWEQTIALADHECQHGRLPTDKTRACGCWPQEHRESALETLYRYGVRNQATRAAHAAAERTRRARHAACKGCGGPYDERQAGCRRCYERHRKRADKIIRDVAA